MNGFHHVALKAYDFDKTVEFYTKGLGFERGISWGEGDGRAIMIDVGGGNYIEVFAGGKQEQGEGAFIHIALKSNNCDADIEKAVNAGAVVTMMPQDVDIPSDPVKKVRIAFCKGLSGEVIEFFEEK
jgi:glyoxylase I family protein